MAVQMPKTLVQGDEFSQADRKVYNWLQEHFGTEPQNFYRQLRWRTSWEADVFIDGTLKPILVRGARGEDYVGPMTLRIEAELHHVMERHGVPAPHVYGMIDDPQAIVMARLPGGINTGLIEDEAARWKVRTEWIQALAKLHAIPMEEFGQIGMPLPTNSYEAAMSGLYQPCIEIVHRKLGDRHLPFVEFLALWLQRNAPKGRNRWGFVTADAGQFLYDGDKLSGLIDFEVGYVGDPACEFAGMRHRNGTEPLGEISKLADYYESITGDRISRKAIAYHTAGFSGAPGSMLMFPIALDPEISHDYISYLHFALCTGRWSLQGIAEALDTHLEPVPEPEPGDGLVMFPVAFNHMRRQLDACEHDDPKLNYQMEQFGSLTQYFERCNRYGQSVLAADIADAEQLTGKKLSKRDEANASVDAFVRAAGPEHDHALLQFFNRWIQRQTFLIKGCGYQSYLAELWLQEIPRRPADDDVL